MSSKSSPQQETPEVEMSASNERKLRDLRKSSPLRTVKAGPAQISIQLPNQEDEVLSPEHEESSRVSEEIQGATTFSQNEELTRRPPTKSFEEETVDSQKEELQGIASSQKQSSDQQVAIPSLQNEQPQRIRSPAGESFGEESQIPSSKSERLQRLLRFTLGEHLEEDVENPVSQMEELKEIRPPLDKHCEKDLEKPVSQMKELRETRSPPEESFEEDSHIPSSENEQLQESRPPLDKHFEEDSEKPVSQMEELQETRPPPAESLNDHKSHSGQDQPHHDQNSPDPGSEQGSASTEAENAPTPQIVSSQEAEKRRKIIQKIRKWEESQEVSSDDDDMFGTNEWKEILKPQEKQVEERNPKELEELKRQQTLQKQSLQDQFDWAETQELYARMAKYGVPKNIHVLGTGNIGKFIAHSLAGMVDAPKVTLLLHRPLRIQQWYDEGAAITLYGKEDSATRTGFEVESSSNFDFDPEESYPAFGPNLETSIVPPESIIDHLIVTTKVTKSVSAIKSVESRLRPTSTICFINNGMGLIEDINEKVFPNPTTRPNYILGVISHGVSSVPNLNYSTAYQGSGTLSLCHSERPKRKVLRPSIIDEDKVPNKSDKSWNSGFPPTVRFLMRSLTSCHILNASGYSYEEFLILQLEKLAVNAVINPLTVIYDCPNGSLLYNKAINRTIVSLLTEISNIILSLPELNLSSNPKMARSYTSSELRKRFSVEKLHSITVSVAEKTKLNISSMLADVRAGRRTEIDRINGYLVMRGRQCCVSTTVNEWLQTTVKGKLGIRKREIENYVPFEDAGIRYRPSEIPKWWKVNRGDQLPAGHSWLGESG